MRIGIDLDWTLAKHVKFLSKFFGARNVVMAGEWKAIVDCRSEYVFNVVRGIWEEYYGYENVYPSLADSRWPNVLRALKDLGHELFLVSNRPESSKRNVVDWLGRVGIDKCFDEILLISDMSNKVSVDVDILVDDTLDNCIDMLKSGRKAILWAKGILSSGAEFCYKGFKVAFGADDVLMGVLDSE